MSFPPSIIFLCGEESDSTNSVQKLQSIYFPNALLRAPRPIDHSVVTEQVKHRSELLWNPEGQDPPGTLDCRSRHEELTLQDPMVDDRILAIVRLLSLEGLHLVPSIQLDHALIAAFVEQWRPETHIFHLPHGEMTIMLQDVEVIMGLPIKGEAMVGPIKRTWTNVCAKMLRIQIPNGPQTVLKGQRILIPTLMVPQPEGVYGPPLPPIPLAMKWVGAMCTKNAPTHVLSTYRNQIATTRPNQVKWEPYGNDLSHPPPSFRIKGSNVWRMEEVMSRHHPYMVWYRRIARLYIDHTSAKMEILFSEESYEYKFIKKALEDMDEVDRIDVPANDEAANQTEIPDVGPSTSLAALVTHHQLAPTPPLASVKTIRMKFCKEYRQHMQGKEETLPVLGFKKLKKVMKKCRRDFRCKKNIDGFHDSQTCSDHCPVCDGTIFPSLLKDMSSVVGSFNEQAQKLLELHLSSGFQKYFLWLRGNRQSDHTALIQKGKDLVSYALINAIAIRKILKKYDKIHDSKQGQTFKSQAQSMRIEILQSPSLCELMAFLINSRESKVKSERHQHLKAATSYLMTANHHSPVKSLNPSSNLILT
ncbi:hypothetical protein SO802_009421 [Lithocarpus litseifolius]|uniref:RING-type E3 ubiquitin transferase n=1 Tax=Lithocarpus litseifolius TaxID=425828 RepID=A0AAW2DCE1_9ROSI